MDHRNVGQNTATLISLAAEKHLNTYNNVTFVDEKETEQYLCRLCREIMTNPVNVGCHENHCFCNKCIKVYLKRNLRPKIFPCPFCRLPCSIKSIKTASDIKRNIDRLKVKCANFQITPQRAQLLSHRQPRHKHRRANNNIHLNDRSRSRSRERNNENSEIINQSTVSLSENPDLADVKNNDNDNDLELCQWTGEYGELADHLKYCDSHAITCQYCKQLIIRKHEKIHKSKCKFTSVICTKCSEQYPIFDSDNHLCPMDNIECQCGQLIMRKCSDSHLLECPEVEIECEYKEYGCKAKFKRKHKKKHMNEQMGLHLSTIKLKCDALSCKMSALESKFANIEERFR